MKWAGLKENNISKELNKQVKSFNLPIRCYDTQMIKSIYSHFQLKLQ